MIYRVCQEKYTPDTLDISVCSKIDVFLKKMPKLKSFLVLTIVEIVNSVRKTDHFVIKTGHLVRKSAIFVTKMSILNRKYRFLWIFSGETFGINNSIANLFLIWWNNIWIIPYPCLQCSKSIYQRKFRKSRFQFEISICLSNV